MRLQESNDIGGVTLLKLHNTYRRRWGINLEAIYPDGSAVSFRGSKRKSKQLGWSEVASLALSESLRWGHPEVQATTDATLLWAIPIMRNSHLLGGLVASIDESRLFPRGDGIASIDIRAACNHLRELAEEYNVTNAALLEDHRRRALQEKHRAEAIHAYKLAHEYDLRAMYQLDEPLLISAIRRGDIPQSRAILNRILVGLMHRGGQRFDLMKSFFMELVASLSRAAVEAGGSPEQLLGTNFTSISELAQLHTEEDLAPWLHQLLERIIASIHRHRSNAHPAMLSLALQFMARHVGEPISRDDVANELGISSPHLSRFFRRYLARGFSDVLTEMRIDRACDLIANARGDLKQICLKAGFSDQSYFTKVFRRHKGVTPAQYRTRLVEQNT